MFSRPVQARLAQKYLYFESWGMVLIGEETIARGEKGREQIIL